MTSLTNLRIGWLLRQAASTRIEQSNVSLLFRTEES